MISLVLALAVGCGYPEAEQDALMERARDLETVDIGWILIDHPLSFQYYGEPGLSLSRGGYERAEREAWEAFEAFVVDAEIAIEALDEGAAADCDPDQALADLEAIEALGLFYATGIHGVERDADGLLVIDGDDCWTLAKLRAIAAGL